MGVRRAASGLDGQESMQLTRAASGMTRLFSPGVCDGPLPRATIAHLRHWQLAKPPVRTTAWAAIHAAHAPWECKWTGWVGVAATNAGCKWAGREGVAAMPLGCAPGQQHCSICNAARAWHGAQRQKPISSTRQTWRTPLSGLARRRSRTTLRGHPRRSCSHSSGSPSRCRCPWHPGSHQGCHSSASSSDRSGG